MVCPFQFPGLERALLTDASQGRFRIRMAAEYTHAWVRGLIFSRPFLLSFIHSFFLPSPRTLEDLVASATAFRVLMLGY